MSARLSRYLWPSCSIVLALGAAAAWFRYVTYGIAFGSIKGLPGRERDLGEFAAHASIALATAVSCQAVAVGVGAWFFIPLRATALARVSFAVGLAVAVDLLTFVLIHGL
jgi:hypothetical protein